MWIYKGKEIKSIDDFPPNTFGFVYRITHLPTDIKYIGKKVLYFERNKKIGKREYQQLLQERKDKGIKGRPPLKKKVIVESDWKEYWGSHQNMKVLVQENDKLDFKREILMLVDKKKLLTYWETYHLFINDVLNPDSKYINDNIAAKYFTKDFTND